MNYYDVDTAIRLSVVFTQETNGAPIDPTNVNLFVLSPVPGAGQQEHTYPGDVIRTGVGLYYYDLIPGSTGVWTYKWQGTGAAEVSSVDTEFSVNPTKFSLSP